MWERVARMPIATPQIICVTWLLTAILLLASSLAATGQTLPAPHGRGEEVFPPLGPLVPRLRFHTGAIKDNQAEISPVLPDIPGVPSQWFVAQWGQHQFVAGNEMTRNDPATEDPRMGSAVYAFSAPDHHSHVWIYQPAGVDEPVYELFEKDGELGTGGGSNIFLSADAARGGVRLDRPIQYRLDARLVRATAEYTTPSAQSSGAVLAAVFTGFVIQFPDPQSGQTSTLFLQILHATSRGINGSDYRSCSISDGQRTIIYGSDLSGDRRLPFKPDVGPLVHLGYSVDRYLCDLISHPLNCTAPDGSITSITLLDGVEDFGKWKLKGIYVGLETEAKDVRPQSGNPDPQGTISVALQLSALHVRRYPDRTFTPGDCVKLQ